MKSYVIILFLIGNFFVSFYAYCFIPDPSRVKTSNKNLEDTNTQNELASADDCKMIEAVYVIISEAIGVGAPTYNQGNHMGCYKIYEGAAYKIIYKYGSKCKDTKGILESALEKSYGDYNATEKAWIMRMAFDKILGVPTITK